MFSVFFDERCSLALCSICWLADNILPWNTKNSLKFSQSQFTNRVLRNAPVLLCIATACRAKVSKSQIQKGKMPSTYLLLRSCLYQELRDTYFLETSVFFGCSSGADSASQHCWCLLCPVGHEDRKPRRNYLKRQKMLSFSTLCNNFITSVPILCSAKYFPACASKREDTVCFATNTTLMPKLQGVM